jgi:hypothetical protein
MIDGLVGVVVGGITGAIIAVNFIITVGIGYDVTLTDIFNENFLVGVVTVGILVAGPVVGVAAMRRFRRQRGTPAEM